MKQSLRHLLPSLAVFCSLATSPLAPAVPSSGVPLWTFTVPPAANATGSTFQSITSDSAGNSLLVLNALSNGNPAGTQIFLLNSKGVSRGLSRIPGYNNVLPIIVSAKRAVIVGDGNVVELTPDGNGNLTFTELKLATAAEGELGVEPTPLNHNYKYVHTTTPSGNFVTTVRRYLATKLKP